VGAPRVFHAKTHAAVDASLVVDDRRPDWARVGLFAEAVTFPAVVRFSSGAGRLLPDWLPDVRGLAVRVLVDAPGRVQDFLAINQHRFPVRRPEAVLIVAEQTGRPGGLALNLLREVTPIAALRAAWITISGLSRPVTSLATETYSTIQPLALARQAALLRFVPRAPRRRGLPSTNFGEELTERLRRGPVEFDLIAHRYLDERRTPSDDPTRRWRLSSTESATLGRLSIPPVELGSPAARHRREQIENLAFSPWHCLAEHTPIGPLSDARRLAYGGDARPARRENPRR
jgi:hypothetical protein